MFDFLPSWTLLGVQIVNTLAHHQNPMAKILEECIEYMIDNITKICRTMLSKI